MVNSPKPPGNNQGPQGPTPPTPETPKPNGGFQYKGEHQFLGMTFTAKDWNKLMNQMVGNLGSYINKVFQKMTEKMKKDWKRGSGEDVDD